MQSQTPASDLDDIAVTEVNDDGDVVLLMPSGYELRLEVPTSMVPYYRRLVRDHR